MCIALRILATGDRVEAQCPSTETNPEDYQKQLLRLAPDMTLLDFARALEKPVWWIFECLTHTPKEIKYPEKGDIYGTQHGHVLMVSYADKFAIHWKDMQAFSLYEDLAGMTKF